MALAACAGPGSSPRERYARLVPPKADPGAVVAAEIAFARAAQDKGQWAAFAEYATADAVMFDPGPVRAQDWLKKQTEPGEAVKWQPHEVWSSCDGSLAVTRGAWQAPNGMNGFFTTIWRRQENGQYKWVLDQGEPLEKPLAAPEFVRTDVASCDPLPPAQLAPATPSKALLPFASTDGSLRALVRVDPWCGRIMTVALNRGNATDADAAGTKRGFDEVLNLRIDPFKSSEQSAPARDCDTP